MERDTTLTHLAAMKFYPTGCIKGLNLKGTWTAVQNLEADGCSRTPPGAMLRRPFRYRQLVENVLSCLLLIPCGMLALLCLGC